MNITKDFYIYSIFNSLKVKVYVNKIIKKI